MDALQCVDTTLPLHTRFIVDDSLTSCAMGEFDCTNSVFSVGEDMSVTNIPGSTSFCHKMSVSTIAVDSLSDWISSPVMSSQSCVSSEVNSWSSVANLSVDRPSIRECGVDQSKEQIVDLQCDLSNGNTKSSLVSKRISDKRFSQSFFELSKDIDTVENDDQCAKTNLETCSAYINSHHSQHGQSVLQAAAPVIDLVSNGNGNFLNICIHQICYACLE